LHPKLGLEGEGFVMDAPKIVFEPYAGRAQREIVEEIINRRNVRLTGHDDWYPVAFFLKSAEGEILGGLLGNIWAQWLYVATLSVREPFRGRSYGTKLLIRAEQYALDRGCTCLVEHVQLSGSSALRAFRLSGVWNARGLSQGPFGFLHDQAPGDLIAVANSGQILLLRWARRSQGLEKGFDDGRTC
jgi:GNAT superfamily N-acetyltransferase